MASQTPTRIPGEVLSAAGTLSLNVGRPTNSLTVLNIGDRPVQVGSHYHFFEANRALRFDRKAAFGRHLDMPAGTAVRFEPGEAKEVNLVPFGGQRIVLGLNGLTEGSTTDAKVRQRALDTAREHGFVMTEEIR